MRGFPHAPALSAATPAAPPTVEAEPPPLPPLREETRLLPGPPDGDGAPTWTLFDPVRHRFFRIGRLEFEILARWRGGTAESVAARVREETLLEISPQEVESLALFLAQNRLLSPLHGGVRRLLRAAARQPESSWRRGWSSYLFLRIPLLHPDPLLKALHPLAAPLFTPAAGWLLALLTLLALHLTLRRWEEFTHTFNGFNGWESAPWLALGLAAVKIAHELGHALTAHHFGLRVPTMGVALMALWPVLYTDTSEAWRLTRRRERLFIGGAGVLAEWIAAVLATLLWHLLPDGPARAFCFFLAAAGWISTLVINLNPFARFDGYHLLADGLEFPNLQERAAALARHGLRRLLWGWDDPSPEPGLAPGRRRWLIAYAVGVGVYRLMLYAGLALLVYHVFFKALGVALFGVEIVGFVLLPLGREAGLWLRERERILAHPARLATVAILLAGLAGGMLLPWQDRLTLPAVLEAAGEQRLHAPAPARVVQVRVRPGEWVVAGVPLLTLEAPQLLFELQQAERRQAALEEELRRQASDPRALRDGKVALEELAKARAEAEGLRGRIARLTLVAPQAGRVRQLAEGLEPGRWVTPKETLIHLLGEKGVRITGYVAEEDANRLEESAGYFQREGGEGEPLPCQVERIETTAPRWLEEPLLASLHGGPLAVDAVADGRLRLRSAVYRVSFAADPDAPPPPFALRGTVFLQGRGVSLLGRLGERLAGLAIRESGF
ncbi:MAG: HlyD family efflux transporter periplasmic adaptor subunit [Magnetococcales bacterium]|nr:HlyD family efflux transporter periplasmic adaptor subunit [Magnetococcales bacterium]